MGGFWPWTLVLFFLLGPILGVPIVSSCPGACVPSFLEDVLTEETQTSEDKDIPAINQGLIPEESPENSFLIEGDILRPSPFQLSSASSNKWPKNGGVVEIPFVLSKKYSKADHQVILEAFAEFERLTCVKFVSYQGQRDFVSIVPMSGCFSSVGRNGGMQVVSLSLACLQKGKGIVLHELMHVLGFWHEQSRADRDHYVQINWKEIQPGFEINFMKTRNSNMLAPYDYSSIMHYGRFAFSRRGQPTIVPLWDPKIHIGQRWNLSSSDISRVLRFYECSADGKGVLAPNHDEPPTSASRPPLPWIWKALVGSSSPRAGSQAVGESPEGQWLPMLKSLGVGTLAKAPQTLASSLGPEQGAGDLKPVPEPSWQVYHPTVPQGNTLLKPALPGAPALDGPFRGIPQDPDCSFCPQVGRGPSTQDGLGSQPVASLGNSPDFQLQTNDLV